MANPSEARERTSKAVGRANVPSDGSRVGRVAACLDGSPVGERILPHARAVARALGTPLTLLRVLEGEAVAGAPPDPLAWDLRRREVRESLERLAARCPGNGPVEVQLIEGQAAEEICRWAQQHEIALTVLCSHGASGETPWSLASTASKLVEGAPGPFLLVPTSAAAEEKAPVARYRRLLVPVNGSALAESVLPLANRLARAHDAELILAHVVPVPELTEIGPLDADDVELRERLIRRNERVANDYLDRLRAQLSGGEVPVRVLVLRDGDARSRLARLIAEEGVDLVVLSSHGRTARADTPLGSVASYLVAHAEIPLLIVRGAANTAVRRVTPAAREDVRLPLHAMP